MPASPFKTDPHLTRTDPLVGGTGGVSLVGAGPGDADLLTLRALRAIQCADVIVYDKLVGKDVLALVPPDTETIYVGKCMGRHSLPQDEINTLLVALARRGRHVVRLKGGDPFIFGRGGEEAEFLAQHGVACEVVPGVTSASGASCCAGIPLTHRDLAQAVVFVTGHRREGGCDLDWQSLARPRQTLVIYMGIANLPQIASELITHGLPPHTPAAVIERATTSAQRTIVASLEALPREVSRHGVKPPALAIVGEVVGLRREPQATLPAAAAFTARAIALA